MKGERAKLEPIAGCEPVASGRLPDKRWLAFGPLPALARWLGAGWRFLRAVSGDDAYERYVAHHTAAHADEPLMTRKAFFEARQQQKWTGVSRCC